MNVTDLLEAHTTRITGNRWRNPLPLDGEFGATQDKWAVMRDGVKMASGDALDLFLALHGAEEVLLLADRFGGAEKVKARLSGEQLSTAEFSAGRAKILEETVRYCAATMPAQVYEKYAKRGVPREMVLKHGLGWSSGGSLVMDHLVRQGFSIEQITSNHIGSVGKGPTNYDRWHARFITPIRSEFGNIVGVNARRCGTEAEAKEARDYSFERKYLLSRDFDKVRHPFLFGEGLAAAKRTGSIVLCEGQFDALVARRHGINAVALCGTSAGDDIVRRIANLGLMVGIAFDLDEPGRKATPKLLMQFWKHGAKPMVMSLPDSSKDLGEYLGERGGDKGKLQWTAGSMWLCDNMGPLGVTWPELAAALPNQGELYRVANRLGAGLDERELGKIREAATLDVIRGRGMTVPGCSTELVLGDRPAAPSVGR